MSHLTCADFLRAPGVQTPVIVRFSTVIHERGSPETLRDPRGFAVKFYTREGNLDLVCSSVPRGGSPSRCLAQPSASLCPVLRLRRRHTSFMDHANVGRLFFRCCGPADDCTLQLWLTRTTALWLSEHAAPSPSAACRRALKRRGVPGASSASRLRFTCTAAAAAVVLPHPRGRCWRARRSATTSRSSSSGTASPSPTWCTRSSPTRGVTCRSGAATQADSPAQPRAAGGMSSLAAAPGGAGSGFNLLFNLLR